MILLMIGAPEIIFIVLIVLLLFGGKKIPVRSCKEGRSEGGEEIKKPLDNEPHKTEQPKDKGDEQPKQ